MPDAPEASRDPRFDPCVKCGRCLSVCPVFLATGREELSPRAKAGLFEDLLAGVRGLDEARVVDLAAQCLGCGRCEGACPLGRSPLAMVRLLNAKRPSFAKALAGRLLGPGLGAGGAVKRLLGRVAAKAAGAFGTVRPFARVAGRKGPPPVDRAMVFSGCAAQLFRPYWRSAALSLAKAAGVEAAAGAFACCGFPKAQAGLVREAAQDARANLEAWRSAGRPVVAVACSSCRAGLAGYAETPGLFESAGERGQWRAALVPFSRLLGGLVFEPLEPAPASVAFHRPCHEPLDDDLDLASRLLPGRVRPGVDACCGFGGLARLANPDVSASATARYWSLADAPPGSVVLTGCAGCALALGLGAPKGVDAGHWLEALAPVDS